MEQFLQVFFYVLQGEIVNGSRRLHAHVNVAFLRLLSAGNGAEQGELPAVRSDCRGTLEFAQDFDYFFCRFHKDVSFLRYKANKLFLKTSLPAEEKAFN